MDDIMGIMQKGLEGAVIEILGAVLVLAIVAGVAGVAGFFIGRSSKRKTEETK